MQTNPAQTGSAAAVASSALFGKKIRIFDTGLNTEELSLVRKYLIFQYPEFGNSLVMPDKNTIPPDLMDRFEFVQPKQIDEFHVYHRQLYTRAKQYMDSLQCRPRSRKV